MPGGVGGGLREMSPYPDQWQAIAQPLGRMSQASKPRSGATEIPFVIERCSTHEQRNPVRSLARPTGRIIIYWGPRGCEFRGAQLLPLATLCRR
jgi:hypothetical protein